MKKNIEWVISEIEERIERITSRKEATPYNEGVERGLGISLFLINQLDKTEVLSQAWIDKNHFETENWAEDLFKSDGETIDHTPQIKVIAVQDLQKQLVPTLPETETVEITEEQAWEVIHGKYGDETLQNNIDYVESQGYVVIEKPTIPQFIADWIEKSRNKGYNIRGVFQKAPKNVEKWLYSQDSDEKIVRLGLAYLLDEYEVEKEQRYFAKIKGHGNISSDDKYWNYCITDESLDIGDNKVHTDVLAEYVLNATKDEWENLGINDDNADFVAVEGLEE